jgi:DNA modification methylase
MRAPYLNDGDVRLYLGDCIEVLREMEAESVDAVVCDPPYGLGFMGKEWDGPGRSFFERKPARGNTFDHVGGNHNPTSSADASRTRAVENARFAAWCETWAREALRVLKPGGHLLAFGGTRTFHRLTCGIEDAGFEVRDCLSWLYGSGFPKSLDVSKAIDKAAGAEREVVGEYAVTRDLTRNGRKGDEAISPVPVHGTTVTLTAPATDAAREWQGWGTALKPAWEPCVVARKPLVGTVAENVQQHGTGALNIDGCRIGTDVITSSGNTGMDKRRFAHGTRPRAYDAAQEPSQHAGRWPANVAFDEAAAAMLDAATGERPSGARRAGDYGGIGAGPLYGEGGITALPETEANTGGASRFFYTAKASRADRNAGGMAENTHPTVKPTDLMRWLVRLVTPPGGVVLDPFAGSGSTLVAARAEGFRAIGIEREDEYARIIADRLSQLSLFSEAS